MSRIGPILLAEKNRTYCDREMLKVGVIGHGYWGPNLVRNFMSPSASVVTAVCDSREERLNQLRKLYPTLALYHNASELIVDNGVDAVVVATPVSSHFDLAMAALNAGRHVLVEKPIASNSEQA